MFFRFLGDDWDVILYRVRVINMLDEKAADFDMIILLLFIRCQPKFFIERVFISKKIFVYVV